MSNSTYQYWEVDGTSLNTLAWNIVSWGGSRESPPPLRGENVAVPYRDGTVWQPKRMDARVITLGMWVIGADEDGDVLAGSREKFRQNWRALRRLLYQPQRQFDLTRRWLDEDEVMHGATAKAQYAGGLEPTMRGPASAVFTVDLMLADPLFYGDMTEGVVAVDWLDLGPLDVDTHDVTGDIAGDVASPRHRLRFDGPLTDPVVTVWQGSDILSRCSYDGTIADGDHLEIEWPSFEWTASALVSPANMTYEQTSALVLDPAATGVVVGGTGAGTATLSYQAAWF